jgi:hypothetical protein
MRILMLYTPRSGSTSILKYYAKINPEYTIVSQPWSNLVSELEIQNKVDYNQIVSNKNTFIKSSIGLFFYKQIPYEIVKQDFDKIFVLSRKNHKEQTESFAHATKHNSFLEDNKYLIDGNLDFFIDEMDKTLTGEKNRIHELEGNLNAKVFYYEDLYYNSFEELFNYLEIEYDEELFKEFLDIKNRYRLDDVNVKKNKSLL